MKTLYEIGYVLNGEIIRGGIKADIRTVAKWIEDGLSDWDDTVMFAVPADDDAISIAEACCKK